MSNLRIYCTKAQCNFYIDWDGVTKQEALDYYKKWNEKHKDVMICVHDYEVAERL